MAKMTPEKAEVEFGALLDKAAEFDNPAGPRISQPPPTQDQIWDFVNEQCNALSPLPGCDELGDDDTPAPGQNCRMVQINLMIGILGGYGCWGNFPEFSSANSQASHNTLVANGRGPPKDDLDRAARDLTQSYKCIMEEYLLETGNTCTPWEETYAVDASAAGDVDGLTTALFQCDALFSVNSCNAKACMVEVLFVARYAAWASKYIGWPPNDDTTFYHSTSFNVAYANQVYSGTTGRGDFVNNDVNCPTTGPVTHVYCCGEYPYRQRLHSAISTDQCCDRVVYNDSTHKCCGDPHFIGGDSGVITPINDAC